MIEQMEHNFIGKQIGLLTDRASEKCTWPCLDRNSVSPHENLANLCRFDRIALASAEPGGEQVRYGSQDPTEHSAQTAPVDRAFAPDAKSNSPADWVREIQKVWTRGPAGTLELARVVSEARNALPHGGWSSLWKYPSSMPFAKRTGYGLLAIDTGLGWANVQTFAHLPSGWSILFELAKLDRATVERLIEEEVVKPTLTLSEAKALVAQFKGKQPEVRLRKANVRERLCRFAGFVRDTVSDWESDERELATEALTQIIEEIGAAEDAVLQRDLHSSTFTTHPGLLTDRQIKL